jgi:hypothetical protein
MELAPALPVLLRPFIPLPLHLRAKTTCVYATSDAVTTGCSRCFLLLGPTQVAWRSSHKIIQDGLLATPCEPWNRTCLITYSQQVGTTLDALAPLSLQLRQSFRGGSPADVVGSCIRQACCALLFGPIVFHLSSQIPCSCRRLVVDLLCLLQLLLESSSCFTQPHVLLVVTLWRWVAPTSLLPMPTKLQCLVISVRCSSLSACTNPPLIDWLPHRRFAGDQQWSVRLHCRDQAEILSG